MRKLRRRIFTAYVRVTARRRAKADAEYASASRTCRWDVIARFSRIAEEAGATATWHRDAALLASCGTVRLADGTPVQVFAHAAAVNLLVGDGELQCFDDEHAALRTQRAEAALRTLLAESTC